MKLQNDRKRATVLHEKDNVATALTNLSREEAIRPDFAEEDIRLEQDIAFGHKFATRAIAQGEAVLKYGVPIGLAMTNIRPGEHVHLHNLMSLQMKGDPHARIQEGGWKNRNT